MPALLGLILLLRSIADAVLLGVGGQQWLLQVPSRSHVGHGSPIQGDRSQLVSPLVITQTNGLM